MYLLIEFQQNIEHKIVPKQVDILNTACVSGSKPHSSTKYLS